MISIVIRCKNEKQYLRDLVDLYKKQDFKDYEIVVVDNESTDGTQQYCAAEGLVLVNISNEEFTHAKSCNMGIEKARYDIVYLTNAHSTPIHKNILGEIASCMSGNVNVAGLFGRCYPYEDDERSTLIERLMCMADGLYWPRKFQVINNKSQPGLLQSTSCAVRKSVLEKENLKFEEMKFGGGEDTLLGQRLINTGYAIIYSPNLDVYHSHGGNNWKVIKRFVNYAKMYLDSYLKCS